MRTLRLLIVLAMLGTMLPRPVSAAPMFQGPMVEHTVVAGDGLAKVARNYCTTSEEIYALNRGVIGANPDMLQVGMVLRVPNMCGGAGGSGGGMDGPTRPPMDSWSDGSGGMPGWNSGPRYETADEYLDQFRVYDRGPRKHATGLVIGTHYVVASGDTLWSISQRFGVAESTLKAANGVYHSAGLTEGEHLFVPGLEAVVDKCKDVSVSIISPTEGQRVPHTFNVRGSGRNLPVSGVTVRVVPTGRDAAATEATAPLDDGVREFQVSASGGVATASTSRGFGTILLVQWGEPNSSGVTTFDVQFNMPDYTGAARIEVLVPGCTRAKASVNVVIGTACAITITVPAGGTQVPTRFNVTVVTQGLANRTVEVRALDAGGAQLARVTRNILTDGRYTFTIQLDVGTYAGAGQIVASEADCNAPSTVAVTFMGPQRTISITSPGANSQVAPDFQVSGTATGVYGDEIIARAFDASGGQLSEGRTSLQGGTTGTAGSGTYSVGLTATYQGNGRVIVTFVNHDDVNDTKNVYFTGGIPIATATPGTSAFLEITGPADGTSLSRTFSVAGRGAGLFEGNVLVTAYSDGGDLLAQTSATLQGADVGTGGQGTFNATLTVDRFTRGTIEVTGPQSTVQPDRVKVGFNGAAYAQPGSSYRDFVYNQCRITTLPGAVAYASPGGGPTAVAPVGAQYVAVRGVLRNAVVWYAFDEPLVGQNMYSWIQAEQLNLTSDCAVN